MTFNLLVQKDTGFIKSAGFTEFTPNLDQTVIELPLTAGDNFILRDEQGRRKIKWDFNLQEIIVITEVERIPLFNPIKEGWKGLTKIEDKVKFLAKIMGLED